MSLSIKIFTGDTVNIQSAICELDPPKYSLILYLILQIVNSLISDHGAVQIFIVV